MIAFQVLVNGVEVFTVGAEDLSALKVGASVCGVLGSESPGTRLVKKGFTGDLDAHGRSEAPDGSERHPHWHPSDLRLSNDDVVTIRVVNATEATPPTSEDHPPPPADRRVYSNDLDEETLSDIYRRSREVYMALKERFEDLDG